MSLAAKLIALWAANAVTLNPFDKAATIALSNGDLTATHTSVSTGSWRIVRATQGLSSGKIYIETTLDAYTIAVAAGAILGTAPLTNGDLSNAVACAANDCAIYVDAVLAGHCNSGFAGPVGATLCEALDLDNDRYWARLLGGTSANWNSNALANPATNTGGIDISGLTKPLYPCLFFDDTSAAMTDNFGASAFVGAIPAGFSTLG